LAGIKFNQSFAQGATMAGVPFILYGRNNYCSWSGTVGA